MREINAEDLKKAAPELRAGDRVLLTGVVYTARDAAHKRIIELLDKGERLPFEIKGAVIYYTGPTPSRHDMPVGSCGPTTSGRMDPYAPRFLDMGLVAMIGKGERSATVAEAIKRNGAVYLCAVGGAGALMARHVKSAEEIAFPELGCESVKRLFVEAMPLTVAIDCGGGDIFKEGKKLYARR